LAKEICDGDYFVNGKDDPILLSIEKLIIKEKGINEIRSLRGENSVWR